MSGPPFDRYPVSSATIREKADAVSGSARPLRAVMHAMDGPRQKMADAVDGALDGQIGGPIGAVNSDVMRTAAGAELCGGAIDLYANYVDIFNRAVDGLNTRWYSAVEHDFGVSAGEDQTAAEHDAEVADARGLLAQQLRKEFSDADEALDQGAQNVARVLNAGPEDGAPMLARYTVSTLTVLVFGSIFPGGTGLTLEEIQQRYQVGDDPGGIVLWEPVWPFSLKTEPVEVTATEAEMLGDLGLLALQDMKDMRGDAFSTADSRFVPEDQNDNHNDAFRHAYWNALMARRFGEEWARNYATAHEMRPDNTQPREAMDLYNNEVGRRIALEHPDASDEEIADLIEEAVRAGDMVIVGPAGNLVWSNTIQEGGETGDGAAHGHDPEGNPDNDVDEKADPDSENEHGSGS